MDTIIGRKSELALLAEVFASKRAEFVAVYGRRRVGKTYLIKNFFGNKKALFFHVTGIKGGLLEMQLERFTQVLGDVFYQGTVLKPFKSWIEAFDALTKVIDNMSSTKKIILFFDELPWMATPKSNLISALEYFWNRHWTDNKRLKLIVCGSSASWMMDKVIKNRGGLHNRTTQRINLHPFSLCETEKFLHHYDHRLNRKQLLKLYMIVGGVPFYLQQLNKHHSLDKNINDLFFSPDSLFFNEFDEVFASLFDEDESYKEIVKLIAGSHQGLLRKDVEKKIKLTGKGGRLTKRLADLEAAGFIASHIPSGHAKRGTYYRLTDEYCYFYLKWVKPIKNELKKRQHVTYWQQAAQTATYKTWVGYAFENICFKHIAEIRSALGLPDSLIGASWRYVPTKKNAQQGAQIDLLFLQPPDVMTLCEIKHTDKPFVLEQEDYSNLQNKLAVYERETRSKVQCYFALITAFGAKNTPYLKKLYAQVVTADCFFE